MVKELKDFLMRGNVIDLAVAVVIGAAFTAVVNAFVEGIINPLVGLLPGVSDLTGVILEIGDADFLIGSVISATIQFVMVGIVLFFMIRAYNRLMDMRKEDEAIEVVVESPPEEVMLLREIRDSLQTRA